MGGGGGGELYFYSAKVCNWYRLFSKWIALWLALHFNPILDGGEGANLPHPAVFLNIAQKPLGLGSWNFVTFSFNI